MCEIIGHSRPCLAAVFGSKLGIPDVNEGLAVVSAVWTITQLTLRLETFIPGGNKLGVSSTNRDANSRQG